MIEIRNSISRIKVPLRHPPVSFNAADGRTCQESGQFERFTPALIEKAGSFYADGHGAIKPFPGTPPLGLVACGPDAKLRTPRRPDAVNFARLKGASGMFGALSTFNSLTSAVGPN